MIVFPPSQLTPAKVTEPDGVPIAGATAATAALNDTACPVTDGLADEVTAVVLLPCLMVAVFVPVLGL